MKIFIFFLLILIFLNSLFLIFHEKIGQFYNLYDIPNEKRKTHSNPVPLTGGIFFLFNITLFMVFDYYFNEKSFFYDLYLHSNREILIFCFCLFSAFIIGFIDDKLKLSPLTKLILLTIVCYSFFVTNTKLTLNYLEIGFLNLEIDLFELGLTFSILSVLFYINSINMIDGINLLASLYFTSIALVLIIFNFQIYFAITFILTCLFFMFLNIKGKIFLGDNGVYVISFIFAIIIISLYETKELSVEKILIFMFFPIIDCLRLFISRILQRKHPFQADEKHLHQILLKKMSYKKTIIFFNLLIFFPILFTILNIVETIYILLFLTIFYFIILKKNLPKT